MKFSPGDIIRFTYNHQSLDASSGDKFKEVLVLNGNWTNKVHGIDLKRLSPAEREVLESVLDPEQKDTPHRIPLVNDIKRRMNPIELITNPIAFYTRFVKPFLCKKDAYRTYVPYEMSGVTIVRGAKIKTGKKPIENPLFGPKMSTAASKTIEPTGGRSPIDIMKMNAAKKGLK